MATLTLGKALNEGLRKALEDDPKVLIMGEDVGRLGGVFRVTDGLQKEDLAVELVYGEARDDLILPDQTLPMNYIKKELDGSMRYAVRLRPSETGGMGYGVRVLPTHPALPGKYDMGLVRWA